MVTGGNSGIGLSMAHALCAAGADVAVWGSQESKTQEAAKALSVYGTRVVAVTADVAEEDDVVSAFDCSVTELGKVDICIACAGISGTNSRFVKQTAAEWHRVSAVNLDGVFYTLRAAAQHLVARGEGGSLIVVASFLSIRGQARTQAYAASKAGVTGLVRACAVELGGDGIRVNAVLPGYVRTPLSQAMLEWESFSSRTLPRIPLGRWGDPEDLGGIAVYLASDASRWHTGDTIVIDGGLAVT